MAENTCILTCGAGRFDPNSHVSMYREFTSRKFGLGVV